MTRPVFPFALALMMMALLSAGPAAAQSRNASFVDPASSGSPKTEGKSAGSQANTMTADPAQVDAGETLVNVARRVTVFFYNGFRTPVQLTQLTVNADGNVRSKVLTDDCKTIKTLPPQDRCSIVMEVVPSSPGPWSVELLLNHTAQGRIARAEITGTTLGKTDEKAEGLAVSKKIAAPLDFGEVHAGEETSARTMLIENDSPEPLKIDSVDLITRSDQGLSLRSAGCKQGDVLKSGESCPITVMWAPFNRGSLSTDLIVHHSGNLGFVVVPIRGNSKGEDAKDDGKDGGGKESKDSGSKSLIPHNNEEAHTSAPSLNAPPPPPSMEQIAKSLPMISSQKLQQPGAGTASASSSAAASASAPTIVLIGTVNGRAILGDANQQSYVVGLGETTTISDTPVEVLQVDATRAVVSIGGVRKELALRQEVSIQNTSGSSPTLTGGGGGSGAGNSSPMAQPAPPSSSPAAPAQPPASPGPGLNTNSMGLNKS